MPAPSWGPTARTLVLPTSDALAALLPDGGLGRGRIVTCSGPAGVSLALATVAKAVAAGSWMAVISMDWLCPEAAIEMGIAAERIVRVDPPGRNGIGWGEAVAGAIDGFEVVLTQPPPGVGAEIWRRLRSRLRSKEAVLLAVGDRARSEGDIVMHTVNPTWVWASRERAHLRARRVEVEVSGRRVPRTTRAELWLPAPDGGIRLLEGTSLGPSVDGAAGEGTVGVGAAQQALRTAG